MEMVDTHIHDIPEDQNSTKMVQNQLVERLDIESIKTEKSRLDSSKSSRLDSSKSFDLEMDEDDIHIEFDENAIVLIRSKLDSVKIEIQEQVVGTLFT